MSKTILTIELTPKTMTQLENGVRKEGSRVWAGRVLANAASISADIGNMLVIEFNRSAITRALRGQGPEDLPAHFGLNDNTANSLVDGMAELIRTSVRISTRTTSSIVSIGIRAIERNWDKYLSLPGAQYISKSSNIVIPVVKWLLVDPSIDIGQAAYDIVFSGENEKFNIQIKRVSRSGRAIMVSLAALGGGGGYVLPSIISKQAGQNFIEYTLGQPNIANKAAKILMKKVR